MGEVAVRSRKLPNYPLLEAVPHVYKSEWAERGLKSIHLVADVAIGEAAELEEDTAKIYRLEAQLLSAQQDLKYVQCPRLAAARVKLIWRQATRLRDKYLKG